MFLCLEIANFSCNFEDPKSCKWTQDKSDDFDWIRNQAYTESMGTGPLTDHTKGLGKCYILLVEIPSPFHHHHIHHHYRYHQRYHLFTSIITTHNYRPHPHKHHHHRFCIDSFFLLEVYYISIFKNPLHCFTEDG